MKIAAGERSQTDTLKPLNYLQQERCYSLKHRRSGKEAHKRFTRAYLAGEDVSGSGDDSESSDNKVNEKVEVDSESYIAFIGVTAAIGMFPERTKWVLDGAMTNTGPMLCPQLNFLSYRL